MPLSMELWVSIFRSCLNSLADRFRSVIYSSFCIQPVHTNTRTHTHKLKLFLSPASISPLYSLLWLLASAAALRSTAGAAERLHFLKLFLGAGEHGRSNPHVSALPLFRRARAFAERFFFVFFLWLQQLLYFFHAQLLLQEGVASTAFLLQTSLWLLQGRIEIELQLNNTFFCKYIDCGVEIKASRKWVVARWCKGLSHYCDLSIRIPPLTSESGRWKENERDGSKDEQGSLNKYQRWNDELGWRENKREKQGWSERPR